MLLRPTFQSRHLLAESTALRPCVNLDSARANADISGREAQSPTFPFLNSLPAQSSASSTSPVPSR